MVDRSFDRLDMPVDQHRDDSCALQGDHPGRPGARTLISRTAPAHPREELSWRIMRLSFGMPCWRSQSSAATPAGGEAFFREIDTIDQTDIASVMALAHRHGMSFPAPIPA